MRVVTLVLIALLALVQYPLWWGNGGWLSVHDLEQQLIDQQRKNNESKARNDRLAGEVEDLQTGTAAIEERARFELGMVKNDEVFVQFVKPSQAAPSAPGPAVSGSTRGTVSSAPLSVVPEPPARGRARRESHRH
ncbi:cell division protein FtsB [Chitinasiproducens palmae]|uniref:Cell division protein FtsB n=1 Tax=Chitinasiproducens palmae TaxID=1770053 RepID=A0A1H2PR20_9BURK|nr:cell division protein FtsB [Chitinasiproducens palmae]SDV49293.1 cell division protein FtsB [Chitinasiproducens palmae]